MTDEEKKIIEAFVDTRKQLIADHTQARLLIQKNADAQEYYQSMIKMNAVLKQWWYNYQL